MPETQLPTDWPELIQRSRDGDDEALGQIVSRVRDYLLFVANGELSDQLQSKFGASDIVQLSMLEAHQSIARFRGTTEAEIRAWLKKIVLSNLIDKSRTFRSRRRNAAVEIPMERLLGQLPQQDTRTANWQINCVESNELLIREINRLPPRQRQVIVARHKLGYSYRKIADDMQVSEDAVRKLWSRGVRQLKKQLGQ